MKRSLFILAISLVAIELFANEDFYVNSNYQYNNAMAYEGEVLILKDFDPKKFPDFTRNYKFFKDVSFIDGIDSENAGWKNYYFDINSIENRKVSGVSPSRLSGKRFYVRSVKRHGNYEFTWIFYLVNIDDDSDQCKFIYHGDADSPMWPGDGWSMFLFPFMVRKYGEHLYGKDKYISMCQEYGETYIANITDTEIPKRKTKNMLKDLFAESIQEHRESSLLVFAKRCFDDMIALFRAALHL